MTWQIRVLIVATIVVISKADDSRRDFISLNADVAPFRKLHPRNFLMDQLFIDTITDQRDSINVPVKDESFKQRAPYMFFKDRNAFRPFNLPIYHRQPFKQTHFALTTFDKGDPLFAKNQESRAQRAIRNNPFEEQSASSAEIFEERACKTRAPLKQQFMAETPLKNLFRGQSPSDERVSFQKQAAFIVDYPPLSDQSKFYQDDPYKPIDSYGWQDARISSYRRPLMHTKYNSDILPSMAMSWPSENLLPLNATMSSSLPIAIDESGFSVSPISSNDDEDHLSQAFKMKLGPIPTLDSVASIQVDANRNALVDSPSSVSSGVVTTVPSISVSANQSSIVGHILTSLTAKPNSPVTATATPIKAFVGNVLEPIYFHATKYGAVVTPSVSTDESEFKTDISASLFAQAPKSSIKNDKRNLKNLVLEAAKNNAKTDIQSPIPSFVLGEKLKGNRVQNFPANYALPEGFKYDWSLQQFSQPNTSFGYAPLSLDGKENLVLPNVPVVPISATSWPVKSDVSTVLPAKSVMASDVTTSNNLPLGINIPSNLMASIPCSLIPSISESITPGISTIPDGTTADIPAGIPTLNLGQSLYRVEQLQRTQEARNPWYPIGLQLELGGFGGINYTLHTSNPTVRPAKLGIAEASLTPPKLPRPQALALAKIKCIAYNHKDHIKRMLAAK